MGWLDRWRKKPEVERPAPAAAEEHAVLIHIRLGDDDMGLEGEVEECHELQAGLEAALTSSKSGILDGDEFGGGECVVYTYGPDAGRMWQALAPVLARKSFRAGSHAIKRYGGPDCERQERVEL